MRYIFVLMAIFGAGTQIFAQDKRPNIVWMITEDMSPNLGCYGDRNAITPNLDKLAS